MPVRGDFNLDPNVLKNFSLDLTPEFEGLRQVREIVPFAPTDKRDFKYQIHSKTQYTDESSTVRPSGAEPIEVDYSLSSASDVAVEHALMHKVTDEQLNDSDDVLDPVEDGVAFLRYKMLLNIVRSVAGTMATTGTMTNNTTLAGVNQWSDLNNSDPVGDVETGKESIRTAFGIDSSQLVLALTPPVLSKLRQHSGITGQLGGGYSGVLNPSLAQLADIFGVRRVVSLGGVYNSANAGQTVSMADVFGKHAWLLTVPDGGLLKRRQRSWAATFVLKDSNQPQDNDYISWDTVGRQTSKGKLQKARWMTGTMTYKFKVVDPTMAYLIKDAVA